MSKYFIIPILFFSYNLSISQGAIYNERIKNEIRSNPKAEKTRSLNLPSSHSLEKYTPHIFNQGYSSMCTAYSLALARTIVYARNNNLTDKNKISAEAYSPYYIYTKYNSMTGSDNFDGGLSISFNKLNEYGFAKMKEVEYPHYYPFTEKQLWDFSVPTYTNLDMEYIKSEKFDLITPIYGDYESVEGRKEIVDLIKSELIKDRPIIFAMNLYKTFFNSFDVWTDSEITYCKELINTNTGEDYCYAENSNLSGMCSRHEPEEYNERHAMSLIAYDDNKYDGAFLIQNSWGAQAHNNGKVWIPYDVFARLAYGIQSLDKDPKTAFDEIKEYNFSYVDNELNSKTREFDDYLDINWFLFAAINIEELNEKDLKKGNISLPNNLSIKGSLSNNLLDGYGEINLDNKYIYKGNFTKGYFDGQGELKKYDNWGDLISERVGLFSNGKFIEGDVKEIVNQPWINEFMHGYTYKGKIIDGTYSGFGRLEHNQHNDFFEGYFDKNNPIKGYEKISGRYEYEGEFYWFMPHGVGKRIWSNGYVEEGRFEYGEFVGQ